ncbi:MAG: outer membrane beta-barrel protein [Bacteroidota bacterium]
MRLRYLLTFMLFLVTEVTFGQFWFGVKAGGHRTSFNYQNEEQVFLLEQREFIQEDLYQPVKANFNYEFGAMMSYTATDRYSVHTEINFERISKNIRSREGQYFLDNEWNYNYLSVPLFLRVSTLSKPVQYYFNLGPKISYLLSAKGDLSIQLFQETSPDKLVNSFDVVYNFEDANNPDGGQLVLDNPNRVQYSLNLGGGAMLDLKTGGRMMLDFRYSWGHSNLGSNLDSELLEFGENVEYSNQMFSFTVGYMIPYNPAELLKGTSTNDLLQTTSKKKKKKKKR